MIAIAERTFVGTGRLVITSSRVNPADSLQGSRLISKAYLVSTHLSVMLIRRE